MGSPTAPCTLEDELALLLAGTAVRRREAGTRIAELSTRIDEERFVGAVIRQRGGTLAPPEKAGTGLRLDDVALTRFAYRHSSQRASQ